MRVDINKEDENYNVLRIETKDDSGDYIEILVPKDEILFNIEDEDPPLEDDFLVSLGISGLAKKGTSRLAKYTKNIKLPGSLTREEIVGIFRRLEIGGSARNINYSVRLVNNKKELDLLWIRISKGSKFIEKRSVPITNKKPKLQPKRILQCINWMTERLL